MVEAIRRQLRTPFVIDPERPHFRPDLHKKREASCTLCSKGGHNSRTCPTRWSEEHSRELMETANAKKVWNPGFGYQWPRV
jgi:hypothetical protein